MGAVGRLDTADAKDRKPEVLTQSREGAKQKTRKQRLSSIGLFYGEGEEEPRPNFQPTNFLRDYLRLGVSA
jgi:hypothetical protein